MDKAAIFADVTRRNALRIASRLPPLDVGAEYARQVSIAARRDFQAACDQHAQEREAIRREVLAEYRARFGAGFGQAMRGRWAVGSLTRKRFVEHMARVHGAAPPDDDPLKGRITYGGGRKDTA